MAQGSGSGNDVEVRFGASIDDLKSKIDEIQGLFKGLVERFAALSAAVGGGAAFKEFIDSANEINSEASKLSRTLGITGEEAGTLREALSNIGASTETYSGAFTRFNRTLRTQSEEMQALGVDTRALASGQKTSNEVFIEALQIVGKYAPGIDQTQIAMRLFGRSVEDVQKLQKLSNAVTDETAERLGKSREELNATLSPLEKYGANMETAAESNRKLNLTITAEGLEATRRYKEAMSGLHSVLEGIEKTIGEAVTPRFTEMAREVARLGPVLVEVAGYASDTFLTVMEEVGSAVRTVFSSILEIVQMVGHGMSDAFGEEPLGAMQVFRNALAIVHAAFIGLRIGVELVANGIKTVLEGLASAATAAGEVIGLALAGDFSAAKDRWKQGWTDLAKITQDGIDRAFKIAEKGRADLDKALLEEPNKKRDEKTPAGMPKGGDLKADLANRAKFAEAMAALEKAQLQAALAIQKEYLAEAKTIVEEAYKDGRITTEQYYADLLQIELAGNENEITAKKAELAAIKGLEGDKNLKQEQRLKLQAQEATLQGAITALELKRADIARENAAQYDAAKKKQLDAIQAIKDAEEKASTLGDIAREKAALDQSVALRRTTAEQKFAIERDLEARTYEAEKRALDERERLIRGTDDEIAKQKEQLANDREAAERTHQANLTAIDYRAEQERMKYSLQAQQGIQNSFSTMIQSILDGTTSISGAFRKFAYSVAQEFDKLIAQKFTERLFDATGANAAIDKVVSFFVDGISSMVTAFIGGQTAQTAAQFAGGQARMGAQAIEKTAEKAQVLSTVAVTQGAEIAKTTATEASAAVRTEVSATASATEKSDTIGSAIASIGAKAWEAAASVYASIAAIPIVGPFLAPAAAIAAAALIVGFIGRIASSEGGEYRVGEDRLNIVHKDETILPAPYAQGLRDLIGKGGVSQLAGTMTVVADQLTSPTAAHEGDRQKAAPNQLSTRAMPQFRLPTDLLGQAQQAMAAASPSGSFAPVTPMAGGGGGAPVHIHVNAIDTQSAAQFLSRHSEQVAAAGRKAARNFTRAI